MRKKRDIETESLYRAMGAYQVLQSKIPDHELLKLARLDLDKEEFTFSKEYNERCVRNEKISNIKAHIRYARAMEKAVKGEPYRLLDAAA
jgi:hypothetical protein